MRTGMNFRLFSAVVAMLLAIAAARAEVETILSRDTTQVGQPVVLSYRFSNTGEPENMPQPGIFVDGLQIVFQGARRESNFSFSFGAGGSQNRSQSVIEYTYAVTPQRPGDFTIQGFEVRVGAQTIRTKPAKLKVVGSAGQPSPAQPGIGFPQGMVPPVQALPAPSSPGAGGRAAQGEPYFGELVMSSKPVYVGQVVPVDIRFYFRADVPLGDLQRPVFSGDGFTSIPLGEPQQGEQMRGDVPYRVITFRSAITPVKTGEIEIPPVTMAGSMMVSAAPPGFDAFFDQFFRRAEPVEVSTRGMTLKVLPLPKEGRPANFSGAIGEDLEIQSSADPSSAGPGEPVTLSLAISGRGNFDAMSAPVLKGAEGWRTYAPKEKFQKDDTIGFAGTKTFEFKLVARSDQKATPGAEFSYFDLGKKKYVTLEAEPQPVDAAGRESSPGQNDTSPTGASSSSPAAGTAPAAAPASPVNDIAAPAPALISSAGRSFSPGLHASWFRWLNISLLVIAALVLPALFLWRSRQRKSARRSGLESASRQAKTVLQKASERMEFYNAAAQFMELQLQLLDVGPSAPPDIAAALQKRISDPLELRELQSVLARRDELKYGGGAGGNLGEEERRRVVSLLEKFAGRK